MNLTVVLTPERAYASGQDRGNASMRKAGRTRWNRQDADAAAALTGALLARYYGIPELIDRYCEPAATAQLNGGPR